MKSCWCGSDTSSCESLAEATRLGHWCPFLDLRLIDQGIEEHFFFIKDKAETERLEQARGR